MCGAYGFSVKDAKEVYNRFDIANTLEDFKPRFNIRPGQMNPVITSHSPNKISRMFWGLIPHWAKDEKYKYSTINAKSKTVAQLATYREPFRHKRCLIPANYFFEPDKIHNDKPPFEWYLFRFKDERIFAFAGVYDVWTDKNIGKELYSYSMLTTEPNEVVGQVHGRMPLILHPEDEATWLNPDITEPEQLQHILKPYQPAEEMESWRVGDKAKNPRNDFPDVVKPFKPQAKQAVQAKQVKLLD
jgi:putative SOS response-associated peptidase YedK